MAQIAAMILAAGRGERMRPLSDAPQAAAQVGGVPLIVHQLARSRARACRGRRERGAPRRRPHGRAGRRPRHGVAIRWSREAEPLETAGGIATAMPLLPPGPALMVSGDIWTTYDYARWSALGQRTTERGARPPRDGPQSGVPSARATSYCTRGGPGRIAAGPGRRAHVRQHRRLSHRAVPDFHAGREAQIAALLNDWIGRGLVTGERFDGPWENVGTPDDLAHLAARSRRGQGEPA